MSGARTNVGTLILRLTLVCPLNAQLVETYYQGLCQHAPVTYMTAMLNEVDGAVF